MNWSLLIAWVAALGFIVVVALSRDPRFASGLRAALRAGAVRNLTDDELLYELLMEDPGP